MTVVDDGIMISDEEVTQLFKPYRTLQSARDINQAGPGLGLYICKNLCIQLGGNIVCRNKIDPEIGHKAFIINVKATLPEEEEQEDIELDLDAIDIQPLDIKKKMILIYEDKMFSQIALENILFEELKLKSKTNFYNNGNTIAKTIQNLYTENNAN